MRGIAGRGGTGFKPPAKSGGRGIELVDVFENLPAFGELERAPILEPINDEWSISDPFEPVDPRDCAKYPASQYCENDLIRFGPPVGFEFDLRSNGCTTCLYTYPVVGWMRLTPTVVCRRDPNCKDDRDDDDLNEETFRKFKKPNRRNENVQPNEFISPECAILQSKINIFTNWYNDNLYNNFKNEVSNASGSDGSIKIIRNLDIKSFTFEIVDSNPFLTKEQNESCCFSPSPSIFAGIGLNFPDNAIPKYGFIRVINRLSVTYEQGGINSEGIPDRFFSNRNGFDFFYYKYPKCCGSPSQPPKIEPPPPPPPFGEDDDRQRKRRPRDRKPKGCDCMCCNETRDTKDNTDKLLREIKEIRKALGTGKLEKAINAAVGIGDDSVTGLLNKVAKRIGIDRYPIIVPESMLSGTDDDKSFRIESNADFLFWLTQQIDTLVGEFPIKIEIKDSDPLKEGDQTLKIELPNIGEAIAEIYGLTYKTSANQEVELNMLLRLALETMQTKNAAIVAQEYARGNAEFLGYDGNTKGREIDYNFDITQVNVSKKDQSKGISLESLLRNSKAWVVGWENNDKETVVNFLRKIMFSAGIIKAAFFRDKKQTKEIAKNIDNMVNESKKNDKDWDQFLKDIKDPNSIYNKFSNEKPDIDEDKTGKK